MKKNTISKMSLISSILCFALTVIIFVFADGPRRWYSGIFFAMIGLVMLINNRRWLHGDDK